MALWILCWSGMWTDGMKAPRRLLWLKIPANVGKRRETQLVDQGSRMLLLHLRRTSKAPQQRRLIVAMTSQHDIIQAYKKQKVICEGIYFGSVFCNRPGRVIENKEKWGSWWREEEEVRGCASSEESWLSEPCLSKLQESRKLMLFDVLTMMGRGGSVSVRSPCIDFGYWYIVPGYVRGRVYMV